MNFEEIIIKILNYINRIKNFKNDDYNFSQLYLKKIENLEIVLKIYIENPVKVIQNINSLYNNYQKIVNKKTKKDINNINKKEGKKILKKKIKRTN